MQNVQISIIVFFAAQLTATMSKISILFLALCLFGYTSASAYTKTVTVESHPTYTTHHVVDEDHSEVYYGLASGILEFLSKIIRIKVDLLLKIKKVLFEAAVRGLIHLKHILAHNKELVDRTVDTIAELVKIVLTKKPHFAFGHVQSIIAEAEHEYLPRYGL